MISLTKLRNTVLLEKKLLKELERAREASSDAFDKAPPNMDSKQFNEYMSETNIKLSEASRKYRMVKTPVYSDLPDYGDVMPLTDFINNVMCGGFIDYDGSGNYVKDGKESDITIIPSDVKRGTIRTEFDTIIWYNR
jgi:hypothetical protein